MIIAVKVVPTEDGVLTAASAREQVWRKMYPSMDAASTEAVELLIMEPRDKRLADVSQSVPTYAQGFSSPEVEVDLNDLIGRGFLLDS
jgi:hypothetical protein